MLYTIGETAKKLGMAPSTLRYYDKEGLLPFAERSSGGMRVFKESDLEWLRTIACLKQTGMKLCDIKRFVDMAMQGDSTIGERLKLIVRQKEEVKARISELESTLLTLEFKEWYYTEAKAAGTTEAPRSMELCELPERFREVRLKLKGS